MTAKYFSRILAASAVFIFFTNLSLYLNSSGLVPMPSFYYIIVLAIAAAPLYLSRDSLGMLMRSPISRWCYGFVMISGFWMLFQPEPSEDTWNEFWLRIVSALFIIILMIVFSNPDTQRWARLAILIAVLLAVAVNVYELFHPYSFSNVMGRSAGFYVNPNQCGAALALGMILSISLLPPRLRLLFAFVAGFGILLTFSRGALVGWIIATLILIKVGEISLKRSLFIGGAIVAAITVVLLLQWNSLQYQLEDAGALNTNVLARIEWFNKLGGNDDSALERKQVAELAWGMFGDKPFFGHGVAASLTWGFEKSSHNQYLNMMVDHGVLGIFILPLLVAAIVWKAQGESKRIGIAFSAFTLCWGFFSHNLFTERYMLLAFSLMAAMAVTSRLAQKQTDQSCKDNYESRSYHYRFAR